MHFVNETSGCVREEVKPARESEERQRCCNKAWERLKENVDGRRRRGSVA
jgi:hypothetical protein